MSTNPTPSDSAKLRIEELECELALANLKIQHVNSMIEALGKSEGLFNKLNEPHYMTHVEMNLYKKKGIEAIFIHWMNEIDAIDKKREKIAGFPLPKK
jgi:hypothetical protein